MNIDRLRVGVVLTGAILLAGCTTNPLFEEPGDARFGEFNRQTMLAQVIDPDPQYEDRVPAYSGARAAESLERYRNFEVERPERIETTDVGTGGGGGS